MRGVLTLMFTSLEISDNTAEPSSILHDPSPAWQSS
jgi:hypothetical protein